MTISTGDSGVTSPNANIDELLIEGGGDVGITIATSNANNGRIAFADPEDNDIGMIDYDHNDNSLKFTVDGGLAFTIDASQRLLAGTTVTDLLGASTGSMTVSTGDSGVTTPAAGGDDFNIESGGNTGMTIASANTLNCTINFADPEDSNVGVIDYDHNVNTMVFTAAAGARLQLDANTGTTAGSGSAGAGNQTVELMIGGLRYNLLHDGTT